MREAKIIVAKYQKGIMSKKPKRRHRNRRVNNRRRSETKLHTNQNKKKEPCL